MSRLLLLILPDAQLLDEGREQAMAAGKLMRRHKIEFDIVYTR
jgi:bisphosphoglycerate-dependent phosphoglycerate mutase